MITVFTACELKDPFGIGRTKEQPFEVVLKADHEREVKELRKALESIGRMSYPGNRTLDDFMRDMGYINDRTRALLAEHAALGVKRG
jgi:hypothetical protein